MREFLPLFSQSIEEGVVRFRAEIDLSDVPESAYEIKILDLKQESWRAAGILFVVNSFVREDLVTRREADSLGYRGAVEAELQRNQLSLLKSSRHDELKELRFCS